ncbi:MAG: hypothetical protein SOZ83_00575 [Sphaerochaetaceae bacterium]|nr:hypothetical protein [Sphaerochaetaceae bacterium]
MKYKTIEASRELRLWIGQVIVPAMTAGIMIASNPNARNWAAEKFNGMKESVKQKFTK